MDNENRSELHKKICVHLTLCVLGILGLIFVFPRLVSFFAPLIVAWIIAMIANPLVRFLEKRIKIMRKHGSVIVIIAVLAVVSTLLYALISVLIKQIVSLIKALPELYRTVADNLQLALARLHQRYDIIPDNIKNLLYDGKNNDKINDYIMGAFESLQGTSVSSVSSVASSIMDVFILSILTIMISYFFIAQGDKIKEFLRNKMPVSVRTSVDMIKNTVLKAIGGYLKACFQIMIVIFIILWIIFAVMHVQYASLIALITSIVDFLPFVGTGTILMPWAVYSIITGEYTMAAVLVGAYVVTLLVRRLLEPKLVGDSVGMSPFLTLLSMFIGFRLIGMLGLIVGIPVGMILKVFYEEGIFDNTIKGIKILIHDLNEYRKY